MTAPPPPPPPPLPPSPAGGPPRAGGAVPTGGPHPSALRGPHGDQNQDRNRDGDRSLDLDAGLLVLGLGARPGVTTAEILELIDDGLRAIGATPSVVRLAATLAARRDEPGIVAAVRHHGWPLVGYPAASLAAVKVPHPNCAVHRAVGTRSVAEAACLLPLAPPLGAAPSPSASKPVLLVPKLARRRVTVAIAWHAASASPDG